VSASQSSCLWCLFAVTAPVFCGFPRYHLLCSQLERARVLYRYALEHLPRAQAPALYAVFVQFEKQHGDRAAIEDVIVAKRRFQYEQARSTFLHPTSIPPSPDIFPFSLPPLSRLHPTLAGAW